MEREESRRGAVRILRAAGARHAPIDLRAVAEHCRLRIRYRNDLPLKVAGFLYRGPLYDVIVVNARHNRARQRFTIGHEIGHWYFGDGTVSFKGIHRDHLAEPERVVDAFAAELLMPQELVRQACRRDHTVAVLARRFQVSRSAMRRRLWEIDGS